MSRTLKLFLIFAGCAFCLAAGVKIPKSVCDQSQKHLTVFLTGNTLSSLKPCGCSGGQLGGFDRRAAIFNAVPAEKRLILDTGNMLTGLSEQDMIKFDVIMRAFFLLGYDIVNLNRQDLQVAKDSGILIEDSVKVITCYGGDDANLPARFTKKMKLAGSDITISVASADIESEPIEKLEEIFDSAESTNVKILVLNTCDKQIITKLIKKDIADVIICPGDSDEPEIFDEFGDKTLVIAPGKFGKYIAELTIESDTSGKLKFEYTWQGVTEILPLQQSLVDLYTDYQFIVKDMALLENYPRFSLPDGLKYVGSETCKSCHSYEYEKWSTKKHAHAYATLEKIGSEYDPECVDCHVVGMQYEQGFISPKKTPYFKNVGCEVCHGPGSKHIANPVAIKTSEPKINCLDCHTQERSGEFEEKQLWYFKQIVHWKEPNTPTNVE